jgi:hypothetical protein
MTYIALMTDYRKLTDRDLMTLANRGDRDASRFLARRQPIATDNKIAFAATESFDERLDEYLDHRIEQFIAKPVTETTKLIWRHLGLTDEGLIPSPKGKAGPRNSDGGPNARGPRDVAKYRRDPLAAPETLSAETGDRAKIFAALGLNEDGSCK